MDRARRGIRPMTAPTDTAPACDSAAVSGSADRLVRGYWDDAAEWIGPERPVGADPCPWCAQSHQLLVTTSQWPDRPRRNVWCPCCDIKGPEHLDDAGAVQSWNGRELYSGNAELTHPDPSSLNPSATPSALHAATCCALGLGQPYSTADVLRKLIDAAEILLAEKNYDGHGWEEIAGCVGYAKERLPKIHELTAEHFQHNAPAVATAPKGSD